MSATPTRERLLSTALDLIWRSDYASVGVSEICKQAGVTKGGFYHHFGSKADLFCEATRHYWADVKQDLDALLSPARSPLDQLEDLMAYIFRSKLQCPDGDIPGCAFFSPGTQCGATDEKILQALQEMSRAGIQYNRALIRALDADGYLEPGVDADQAARLMHQYLQGALIYGKVHRSAEQLRDDVPAGFYRLIGLKREYWHSRRDRGDAAQSS